MCFVCSGIQAAPKTSFELLHALAKSHKFPIWQHLAKHIGHQQFRNSQSRQVNNSLLAHSFLLHVYQSCTSVVPHSLAQFSFNYGLWPRILLWVMGY